MVLVGYRDIVGRSLDLRDVRVGFHLCRDVRGEVGIRAHTGGTAGEVDVDIECAFTASRCVAACRGVNIGACEYDDIAHH